MSVPAYPDYKDSGVAWLGDVPSHWQVVPFRTLYRRVKRVGFPEAELLSVYRDYGVIRKADRDDNFNNASEDLAAYQLVEPGDLAINKMKAWQGSLGVSPHRGIVSPAYFVFEARHAYSSAFLHYLLRSPNYAAAYMTVSKGIRINQWDIDPDYLAALPVPIPALPEQTAIAAFLDRETAKIDALVAEQQRLIALLKEKRQAVISHAVTKGLNPNAPMKDSGIEWLGEIPAHWELTRTSRHFKLGMGETILSTDLTDDGSWPVFSATEGDHYFGRLANPRLKLMEGDLVIPARGNSIGHVKLACEPCTATQTTIYARIFDRTEISPEFAYWFMRGLKKWLFPFVQTAIPQITTAEIGANVVLIPDQSEQIEIVKYIKAVVERFELLIAETQSAITLLQERRAALISAAVTGKIDVRGLAVAPAEMEVA